MGTTHKNPPIPKKEKMSVWSRCLKTGRCGDKSNKITLFWLVDHESDIKMNEENQDNRPDNLGQLFFFHPRNYYVLQKSGAWFKKIYIYIFSNCPF